MDIDIYDVTAVIKLVKNQLITAVPSQMCRFDSAHVVINADSGEECSSDNREQRSIFSGEDSIKCV